MASLPAPPLADELAALTTESGDGEALRAPMFDVARRALERGRAGIRRRFEADADGAAVAAAHAALIDGVLRDLCDFANRRVLRVANPTAGERFSLVAVGGYGRGELAPHSDIDLLFLLPYKRTPAAEQLIELLLYTLWDLGLKVGHAARTVGDCLRRARQDVTIRTALLESRHLWGDPHPFEEFKARLAQEIAAHTGPEFVEAKLAERDARHRRVGDSRYVLEPNVKDGKGGLRDLHTLFWIGKYLYRAERVAELVPAGVLTREEYRRFVKAERFLWTVRCWLHYLTGRAEERLTFDLQPEVARRLGYTDRTGARGVERFMKHYFLVAKAVGDLTRIFCAALEAQHQRQTRPRPTRLGLWRRPIDGFLIEGPRINLPPDADDRFAREPIRMLEVFRLAQARKLDVHPRVLKLTTRNLSRIDHDLRQDPAANACFLEILTSPEDPETALRRMNEAGVLGRFVPEFGRVVAQMQYNMYHHYTVDEHLIRAVGVLSQIERGALRQEAPVTSGTIHHVVSRRALYVATFLHDIGKGRGGDHSVIGAEIALGVARRLGLSAEEVETVVWLVRHHLLFSNTAFRRDIDDPKTVADFVGAVQSRERLRLLLALTVADIRAVAPGVWNGWKAQLLRDLYNSADEVLSGGDAGAGRERRVRAAQAALRAALPDWSDADFEAYVGRHYPSYWLACDQELLARHARLVRRADLEGSALALDHRVDPFRAVTEVSLYTPDHPGLFAEVAGAMAVTGASIADAKIFTTTDGMALDTFWIQDVGTDRTQSVKPAAFDQPHRLAKLAAAIEQALTGRLRMRAQLAGRPPWPRRADVFAVEPRVLVDNGASATHTVIEVNGRDRPGFLHDVTRALSELGLSIASAHINTFGERVNDVFYVKDVFGLKVRHPEKIARIRARLLAAVADPESAEADDPSSAATG